MAKAKKDRWVIGIGGTDCDDVNTYIVFGTDGQVKKHLLSLVKDARAEFEDNEQRKWCGGTTCLHDFSCRNDFHDKPDYFYAHADFPDYHIDYTATRLSAMQQTVL